MRAMPNTPTAVGAGMSVLIASPAVSDEQRRGCEALFGAVGEVAWFDEESLLDVATAVCGSGPAYVFRFTEALAEAGQAAGLEPALALRMARATLLGAGALAAQSEPSLAALRAAVTSPGGTTAAGLAVLDHDAALSDLLAGAVRAAAARSATLADGAGAGPRAHGPPTTLLDPLAQAEGGKPL
jgi:pyrroline-5-carboxylate reductase